jgi:hypothetical protein
VLAPKFYPTVREARKVGKKALAAFFEEHYIFD